MYEHICEKLSLISKTVVVKGFFSSVDQSLLQYLEVVALLNLLNRESVLLHRNVFKNSA